MKNSAKYEKKVKKLLAGSKASAPPEADDLVQLMLLGILEEDTTATQAAKGVDAVQEEFVDYNELRASPAKDISECLGKGFPGGRAKAVAITTALNTVFDRTNTLDLDFLASLPKRELRRTLREDLGLSIFAESVLTLCGFAGHAIPVDNLLAEALKLDGNIHSDSDLADLQGFLERIILNKDAYRCYLALRKYAAKNAARVAKELEQRRKLAEAEAAAKAKAEAAAKAKAEALAAKKAEALAKKKAAAAKKKAAKKKAAAAKKKSAKKKGARKKTVKKAATKKKATRKKTARKAGAKKKSAAKKKTAAKKRK